MKTINSRIFVLLLFILFNSCGDSLWYTEDDGNALPPGFEYHLNEPEFLAAQSTTDPRQAFSKIVKVGEMYFLSGQIGKDPTTNQLVPGGIEAETRQAIENIKTVLAEYGVLIDNVVKVTVILDDIEDFAAFNSIFMEYFPQKPARTTFAAESLAKGAKIEIEVIAVQKPIIRD
ncbi:MAG: RidA family protein [Flavobacterium sp.]|nr:MAG: RidA family protein [Flavobacterium sp.]